MIKPNKTIIYDCPEISYLLNNRTLMRTGAYADGNCFYHALLRAIDTNYRKQNNVISHSRIVEKFRKDISEWVSKDIYQSLGKGENCKLSFQQEFNDILKEYYGNIEEHPQDIDINVLQIIFQILPLETIDTKIIPNILSKPKNDNFYVKFCAETSKFLREQIGKKISKEKLSYLCNQMCDYFIWLFEQTHERIFHRFKSSLKKMGYFADSIQLECISKYVKYNFLFLNEATGKPYEGFSHIVSFIPSRETIIFLWVNENHFEIIGELEENNIINRIFSSDDPLVIGIKSISDNKSMYSINEEIETTKKKSRSRTRNSPSKNLKSPVN